MAALYFAFWAVYIVSIIKGAQARTIRARGWWSAAFLAAFAGIIICAWVGVRL